MEFAKGEIPVIDFETNLSEYFESPEKIKKDGQDKWKADEKVKRPHFCIYKCKDVGLFVISNLQEVDSYILILKFKFSFVFLSNLVISNKLILWSITLVCGHGIG